ncbi:hypothetical protein PspLS_01055 [Pyricularia sp. CBS 133598]|nr:hypothetical protein PspLS_01055 [Pyricularia sp. CBS 133598]
MLPTKKQALAGVAVLTSGALAQVAGEDWAHIPLGCIAADFSGLPPPVTFVNNNEVVCSTYCYENNFGTAASQGTQCYCGPTDLDGEFRENQEECDIICPGAQSDLPDEACGGTQASPSVYNFYAIFNLNDSFPTEPPVTESSTTAEATPSAPVTTTESDIMPTPPVVTSTGVAPDTVSTTAPGTVSTAPPSTSTSMSMSDDEGVLPGGGTESSTATGTLTSTTSAGGDDAAAVVTETATSTWTTTACTNGLCGGFASPTGVLPAGWKIFIEITIVPLVEPCADGRMTTTMAPSTSTRYYDPAMSTTTIIIEDSVTRTILVPVTRVTASPWSPGRTNGTDDIPVQANGAAGLSASWDALLRGLVSLGVVVVGAAIIGPKAERQTQLSSARLVLRGARPEDAAHLHVAFNRADVMKYWSTLPHASIAETEKWVNGMMAAPCNGVTDFIICLKTATQDGRPTLQPIGKAGVWRDQEIGFMIARQFWGQGLATEAVSLVLDHLFFGGNEGRSLIGDSIVADVDPRNEASLRVLGKLGFVVYDTKEKTFEIGGEIYTYKAIDLATDAIRLFRLFPASDEEANTELIRCEIFETFLHEVEGVPYEALSYTWGDATDQHEIELNGKGHLVTSNLYQALRDLRLENEDRVLWVDAICINQQDVRERGHQVGQMTLTYQNAERVLIWLGPGSAQTDAILTWMNALDQRVVIRRDYRRNSTEAWRAELVGLVEDLNDSDCIFYHPKLSPELTAMIPLLYEAPWFRRIWILQEAANARFALVMYGRQSVPSRTFSVMPMLMGFDIAKGKQTVLEIMPGPLRASSWWKERHDLELLIAKFAGHCEAGDERDKIYALLGMASDSATPNIIVPDYEISLQVVIQRTLVYLLSIRGINVDCDVVPSWKLDDLVDSLPSLCSQLFGFAMKNAAEPVDELGFAIEDATETVDDRYRLETLAVAVLPQITASSLLEGPWHSPPMPALCFLARNGLLERLLEAILLRNDLDMDAAEGDASPIILAAQSLNWKMVYGLLRNDRVNIWTTCIGWPNSVIGYAALEGRIDVMHLFVKSPRMLAAASFRLHVKTAFELLRQYCIRHAADYVKPNRLFYKPRWQDGLRCNLVSDFLESLWGLGEELDFDDKSTNTPWLMWLSAALGDTAAIKWLVSRGVNADIRQPYKSRTSLGDLAPTPLWIAACCGQKDAVQLLVDMGADIRASSDRCFITPLTIALGNCHEEVALYLLENGAPFQGISGVDISPLWIAATEGQIEILRRLLDLGATEMAPPPAWKSSRPVLPAHISNPSLLTAVASSGNLKALKTLLEHETYMEDLEKPLFGNIDLALLALVQTGTGEGLKCAELILDRKADLLGSAGSDSLFTALGVYFHSRTMQVKFSKQLSELRPHMAGKEGLVRDLVRRAEELAGMQLLSEDMERFLGVF